VAFLLCIIRSSIAGGAVGAGGSGTGGSDCDPLASIGSSASVIGSSSKEEVEEVS
jgi:hypothetical protein